MGRKYKVVTVKYVIISHNRISGEIQAHKTTKGAAGFIGIPYVTLLYWLKNNRKYLGRTYDVWRIVVMD